MRKWSKFLMIFVVGVLGVTLGFVLTQPNQATPPPEEVLTTSTTLSTNSSIFKEITTDGLASYLEIKIPDAATNIKGIKITQTIGSVSSILTQDEKGVSCYYSDDLSNASKNTTFYFTRPATYTVQYILGNDVSVISESCSFKPEINGEVLKELYTTTDDGTTKNMIMYSSSAYYFTHAGEISIPRDSHNLYSFSASINYSELEDDILTAKTQNNPTLLTTIPDNSFGTVTYTITSNNGHTKLIQDITILTTKFDINFKNEDTFLNKSDYFHNGGYVFNSGIGFTVDIDSDATNILTDGKNTVLTDNEKLQIFNILDFELKCEARNVTNTSIASTNIIDLTEPSDNPTLTYYLNSVDHTIYTLTTKLKQAKSANYIYENNIQQFKIITKVPINENGNYVISLILGQIDNRASNNYLDGVLDGYLTTDTTIYYPTTMVRLFYNGYTEATSYLSFSENGTSNGTLRNEQGYNSRNFSINNETIQIISDSDADSFTANTLPFEQFYSFTFNIKTYSNSSFVQSMLNGQMSYNNGTILESSGHENELTSQINSFKYIIPDDYSETCIPLYMRVTYNGTSFDDVYTFNDNDYIEFTEYGNYSIEFYNVPSYDYIVTNYISDNDSSVHYYYNLKFTIAGPSIYASTTGINGKTLTVSNNMYTQNVVAIKVGMLAGQQMVIYKNGEEYARRDASMEFSLSNIGTWKINIIDAEGTILRSLTFTIADSIYQGFTINDRDEYENLTVSTQISSMPVTYSPMEKDSAYHLTYAGTYKIDIDARETLSFSINGISTNSYTINSNSIVITIQKSYFALYFSNGAAGTRTSTKVIVSNVGGVQLQSLEVYLNNELLKTFTSEELANWDTITEGNRSFSNNGTYTFKLTDKFGNTYEAQMEKYYKVNVALILLIILAIACAILLIVTIIKTRHKIKVK